MSLLFCVVFAKRWQTGAKGGRPKTVSPSAGSGLSREPYMLYYGLFLLILQLKQIVL